MRHHAATLVLCLSSLSSLATGQPHPRDWFSSEGRPTFDCVGVGRNASRFRWFQVLHALWVLPVTPSDANYAVSGSQLEVRGNVQLDRDLFCEATSLRGRWRSRLAQLRFGWGRPLPSAAPFTVQALTTDKQRVFDSDNLAMACGFASIGKRVVWLHNARPIAGDRTRVVETRRDQSVLYIINFDSSRHAGVYQCMVEKTDGSWRPLRKPLDVPLSQGARFAGHLPFRNYEVGTAGEVALNDDNLHAPNITSVKGYNFSAYINDTNDIVALTSVVVFDMDRGGAGRVTCTISCDAAKNRSCPFFEASTSDVEALVGTILIGVGSWKGQVRLVEFNLTCIDKGKNSRSTTSRFAVAVVRQKDVAFRESKVTTQLVRLAAESLEEKLLNGTSPFLESLTNATKDADSFTAVDFALATAKTVQVVALLAKRKTSSSALLEQVFHLFGGLMRVNPRAMDPGPALKLLRAVDEFVAAVDVSNKTFASKQLALVSVALDAHDSEIVFGSPSGTPEKAAVSVGTSNGVAISVRTDHVVSARLQFAMFNDSRLFAASRSRVLSPVISAGGALKLRESVTLFFDGGILSNSFSNDAPRFCALWVAHHRTWDPRACNSSLSGRATVCRCSRLGQFALLLDLNAQRAREVQLRRLAVVVYVLWPLSCAALLITLFINFRYLWLRRVSHELREWGTVLARERLYLLSLLIMALFFVEVSLLEVSLSNFLSPICSSEAMFSIVFYLFVSVCLVFLGTYEFLLLVIMVTDSRDGGKRMSSDVNEDIVFENHINRKVMYCLGPLPFVIAVIPLVLNFFSSRHKYAHEMSLCFPYLSLRSSLTFVLPQAVYLMTEVIILALWSFGLKYRSRALSRQWKSQSKNRAIAFFCVCVRQNITLVIGFLQFGPWKLVMNYIYIVVSCSHGLLIFVLYGLLQQEIRELLRQDLRRCWRKIRRRPEMSPQSGSSDSMPRNAETPRLESRPDSSPRDEGLELERLQSETAT